LLLAVLNAQDWVISREEALAAGLTPPAIKSKLRRCQWQAMLPGVYLTHPGKPTRRQMLLAALLYAGPEAAIDAVDACFFHGMRAIPVDDEFVRVAAPFGSTARSRGFVVVRRTTGPLTIVKSERLRYVDPASAAIAATRLLRSDRAILAVLSEALQRRFTTYDDLVVAHVQGPPRNARAADDALESLGAGVRSAPEGDFRQLALASTVLPPPEFNVWVRLVCGRVVCLDALIESSALVHETNGRKVHAREDLFEDMQERHDAITASGFVALHNSPRRIRTRGREVIAQVERTHEIYAGRGMPAGVQRLPIAV
jgi:hypothetical protein